MINLTPEQITYLDAMNIPLWISRQKTSKLEPATSNPLNVWENLKKCVSNCTACDLSKTRTQTVFGVGNPNSKLMIIGEAPGFYEDKQGEPFVGRAGQLLNAMLIAIGLKREDIYIANILKCRPPSNRDPLSQEVDTCTPFLLQQISLLQPRLLVTVGRIAAHFLLNTKVSMTQMRGKQHSFQDIPLLVTFHPAYLLRNPQDKRKAFEDLQLIKNLLQSLAD